MGKPLTAALRPVALDEARRTIAALMLADRGDTGTAIGDVELWPHQRGAVTRLRAAIAEFGGALLADDVGTGKTFAALAVASGYTMPLVVAPAGLRESWRRAAARVGRTLHFVSFESLSRGRRPPAGHDIIIVDEAHHARNPVTKRYSALARMVAGLPVLLLSATPIHNDRDDLVALLALFLGAAAAVLDDAALARCVVRRGRAVLDGAARVPAVRGPIALASDAIDDATPGAILALPPPLPAADAGTADALVTVTLLRQWASSQGALLAAIRRRLAAAHALASTLDSGRYPTRAELSAWTSGDDAQQLVMSELLAPAGGAPPAPELRAAVAAHIEGLRALRRIASADPGIDARRARRLRDLWNAHPGARSIAFTQFAETVSAYWRELRDRPRTCALTAAGGRVAGGPISRAEALGSFAPGGGQRIDAASRIDALLVTDLASEGLDLQEGSVLVHLDLPWTPARLEQRVGRIVRPGSRHAIVHVYAMEPPARAATLLDIHRRLEAKLAAARAAFGDVMPAIGLGTITDARWPSPGSQPLDSGSPLTLAAPAAAEQIERLLRRWTSPAETGPRRGEENDDIPVVSVVRSGGSGWLALVGSPRPRMVAAIGHEVSDAPSVVAEVCARIDAVPCRAAAAGDSASAPAVTTALGQLASWLEARRGAALAGVPDIAVVRGRRRALSAIARIATTPASDRVAAAPAASCALSVASRPLAVSFERDLRSAAPDAELISSLTALPRLPGREAPGSPDRVRALIVLSPGL